MRVIKTLRRAILRVHPWVRVKRAMKRRLVGMNFNEANLSLWLEVADGIVHAVAVLACYVIIRILLGPRTPSWLGHVALGTALFCLAMWTCYGFSRRAAVGDQSRPGKL